MRSASSIPSLRGLQLSASAFPMNAVAGTLLAMVRGLHAGSRRVLGGQALIDNRVALDLIDGKLYVVAGSAGTGTEPLSFWIEEEHINTSNKKRRTTFVTDLEDLGGGGPGPGPVPTSLKLSYPSTRYWMDTAATGDTLATIEDMADGATASVQLTGQAAYGALPVDAVTVVGDQIRAGTGWDNLPLGAYILDILCTKDGGTKRSRTYCEKLSNKPADYTVTDDASLAAARAAVTSSINTLGAAFPGAVIELTGSAVYSTLDLSIPTNGRTKQVVFRSAAADRVAGAYVNVNKVICRNMDYTVFQRVRSVALTFTGEFLWTFGDLYQLSRRIQLLHCASKGGDISINPDGSIAMDWQTDIDPTTYWRPGYTNFLGTWSGGALTRVDLKDPHSDLSSNQTGAALGVWATANPPAFISAGNPNTPDGTTGIHPLQFNAGAGTGAAADFEVLYLTDATTPAKPAGAPDGFYVTRWRLTAGGSGYTGGRADSTITWQNMPRYNYYPWCFNSTSAGKIRDFIITEHEFRDFSNGVRDQKQDADDEHWNFFSSYDRFAQDANQSAALTLTHSRVRADRRWGCVIGRFIHRKGDWGDPHGDGDQQYGNSGSSGTNPYLERRMNLFDGGQSGGAGKGRGGFQGFLYTDNAAVGEGHRVTSFGDFIRGGITNGFNIGNPRGARTHMTTVANNYGNGSGTWSVDAPWVTTKSTVGTLRPMATPQFRFDGEETTITDAAKWVAPTADRLSTHAQMVAGWTPKPGWEGWGPAGDLEQSIDPVNRVFDDNMIPVELHFLPVFDLDPGETVTSSVRELFYGLDPKAVDQVTDCQWRKAASSAGITAAGFTSGNGTFAPDEWMELQATAPAALAQSKTVSIRIGGTVNYWRLYTKDAPTDGPISNGTARALMPSAITGGSAKRKAIYAFSFDAPATGSGRLATLGSDTNNYLTVGTGITFRLSTSTAVNAGYGNVINPGGHNLVVIALDFTKISPVTDEESGEVTEHANGAITCAVNRVLRAPTSGQIDTLDGTRTLNFLSGVWAVFGNTGTAAYLPADFRLHWMGLRVYEDAEALPDLHDPDILDIFTNAGIGANGENWPGGLPQLFFRDDADVWNDPAGAPNRGTLATVPNLVLNGSGTFGGGSPAPTIANLKLPVMSGAAYVGQTSAIGPGLWDGAYTSLTKQWQRADSDVGPWSDIPGATGDFYTKTAGDLGKVVACLVTVSDGVGTGSARSLASPVVQAMATPIPAPVSNPVIANLGASFEETVTRGSGSADRISHWLRPAIFGRFMLGNKRMQWKFTVSGSSVSAPYLDAVAGASATAVASQATALTSDSAYLAEAAHAIFINFGSNTLDTGPTGGSSWLSTANSALGALRAAYPSALIIVPEQMMRSEEVAQWQEGGYARANVLQVNAGIGAIASNHGAIVVPWYARSGDPSNALEGRDYPWRSETDLIHPAGGRGWEMSRSFAAAVAPYLVDLGEPSGGTVDLTSVGAGSGGTITGGTGTVWNGWIAEVGAGFNGVASLVGDTQRVVVTATADTALSAPMLRFRRATGRFFTAAIGVTYTMRLKMRIRSTSKLAAYLRVALSNNNSNLGAAIEMGALTPGNMNGGYTLSTITSGAVLLTEEWVELSLESVPMTRTAALAVTPLVVVETRNVAGGALTGQGFEIEILKAEIIH